MALLKDRLKRARLDLNLTLDEVAKKVGVSRQTIQRYESGVISNIPSDNIEKLAEALETTPAELMGWNTAPPKVTYNTSFDSSSPSNALFQAYNRKPELVKDEIIRRLVNLDSTFALNVCELLEKSGDINGFMKETGLDFGTVGEFMQGKAVKTNAAQAERIAAFFNADIVSMFFEEDVIALPKSDVRETQEFAGIEIKYTESGRYIKGYLNKLLPEPSDREKFNTFLIDPEVDNFLQKILKKK